MRIKTGDAVNFGRAELRAGGQKTQSSALGRKPVALLDGPQIVKNHGARLAQKRPAGRMKNAERKVE